MALAKVDQLRGDPVDVRLESRQVFLLFFGGAISACLVFALGVMVGRRLEARSAQAHAARAAAPPLAAMDRMSAEEAEEEAAASDDALSYHRQLASGAQVADPLRSPVAPAAKPAKPAASPSPSPSPSPAKAVAAAKPAASPAPIAVKPAASPSRSPSPSPSPIAAKPTASPSPSPAADKPAANAKPTGAALADEDGRHYTLQLPTIVEKADADAMLAKLTAAGYKPRIVAAPGDDGRTWYRIRLGDFASHPEAVTAKTDFERKQHIIAYVARL